MARSSGIALPWLYLAVLGPLVLLAGLAWTGTRSQLKAAWTEAREEAAAITESRSATLASAFENAVISITDYADPPVPGTPSELDAILDHNDPATLLELRNNPDAGLSPAGLPRQVLAALRLHKLDPTAQDAGQVIELVTTRAPSVITAIALAEFAATDSAITQWKQAEQIRTIARENLAQSIKGHWVVRGKTPLWAWRSGGRIDYLHPERVLAILDELQVGLPAWAHANLETQSGPLTNPFSGQVLATREIPFSEGLVLSLAADPTILEKGIRRQQKWTVAILATSVLVASISLFTIHRTVARERHLAELKSQFVSSVSHELRAPLGSIRLMAEALQQEKVKQPREFHTLIAREGARLSHLIENVLDFARIEEGRKHYRFEECDIRNLIRDTLQLMKPLAHERGIALQSDLQEIIAAVDPAALQQALVNLLDNAIKFSPPKGTVNLTAATLEKSLQITITDQGPGIPATEQEKIFERFHRLGNELRRETQGTGIGLSIVKHIAEAHDGAITVHSTPPDGSSFTLTLPTKQCDS